MEKMAPIEGLLRELGLAREHSYSWYDLEVDTGTEFMAYLAGCLCQLPEIQSVPITDEESNLTVFLKSERDSEKGTQELNSLRMQILERIFPAPNCPLRADEIENFKQKHGGKLRTFRRAVEREVLAVAEFRNLAHRERRIQLFQDEIQELVEEIRAGFYESGFAEVVLGKLCPLLGAIPGAPYIFGLAHAIHGAFGKGNDKTPISPLVYAAYAQVELLNSINTAQYLALADPLKLEGERGGFK